MSGQSSLSGEFDEDEFNNAIREKRYEFAWELIRNYSPEDDGGIYFQKAVLLGSGFLKTGIDRCGAVRNLETAEAQGAKYARGALNYLYRGDWATIAALEGSPAALFEIGERMRGATPSGNPFAALDPGRNIRLSYNYFKNASMLGHKGAQKELLELEREFGKRFFEGGYKKMSFRSVICQIRQ